ncbi:hypothetical protein J3F83DRAFT_728897 [Trichoderma novae-zelandiae]
MPFAVPVIALIDDDRLISPQPPDDSLDSPPKRFPPSSPRHHKHFRSIHPHDNKRPHQGSLPPCPPPNLTSKPFSLPPHPIQHQCTQSSQTHSHASDSRDDQPILVPAQHRLRSISHATARRAPGTCPASPSTLFQRFNRGQPFSVPVPVPVPVPGPPHIPRFAARLSEEIQRIPPPESLQNPHPSHLTISFSPITCSWSVFDYRPAVGCLILPNDASRLLLLLATSPLDPPPLFRFPFSSLFSCPPSFSRLVASAGQAPGPRWICRLHAFAWRLLDSLVCQRYLAGPACNPTE